MFVTHIVNVMLVANDHDKYPVLDDGGQYANNSWELYFDYNAYGKYAYAFETFTPQGIG